MRQIMLKRTISSLAILAIGLPVLMIGGIPYFLLIAFLLVAAAWEYSIMFRAAGRNPSRLVLLGGIFIVIAVRSFFPAYSLPALEILILLALAIHLFDYERGQDGAALDFGITISGLIYLGWVGAYLLDLRSLPNGAWWVFLALPCVWMADSGAYVIGAAYGKHKMAARLSPKKSWEGYWAGVFTALLSGMFFAFAYTTWGPLDVAIWQGGLLGLLVGLLTPLGDLGESMFKRQVNMKDSGNIIPGHGGAFDRIDSWLWGAILSYYFIVWFL
jgi:phosphatidate cytidylyltransferase